MKNHNKHIHCHTHHWAYCCHCNVYYCTVEGCNAEERHNWIRPWQPYPYPYYYPNQWWDSSGQTVTFNNTITGRTSCGGHG